jgi:hypothetical protein
MRRGDRSLHIRSHLWNFFTPRYVEGFLTENTLARIWIEMMGENGTGIAERCEFLGRDAPE